MLFSASMPSSALQKLKSSMHEQVMNTLSESTGHSHRPPPGFDHTTPKISPVWSCENLYWSINCSFNVYPCLFIGAMYPLPTYAQSQATSTENIPSTEPTIPISHSAPGTPARPTAAISLTPGHTPTPTNTPSSAEVPAQPTSGLPASSLTPSMHGCRLIIIRIFIFFSWLFIEHFYSIIMCDFYFPASASLKPIAPPSLEQNAASKVWWAFNLENPLFLQSTMIIFICLRCFVHNS